jgi:hypothetical protein
VSVCVNLILIYYYVNIIFILFLYILCAGKCAGGCVGERAGEHVGECVGELAGERV